MTKSTVAQWDTVAANNTDVGGVALGESVMTPSGVNNALREMMAQIKAGAVLFPASVAVGDIFYANSTTTVARLAKGTALQLLRQNSALTAPEWISADSIARTRRNRIVNPAMQISQENVNTAGTTHGYYAADQFAMYRVTSAGTFTAQRVQSVTSKGSKDRFRVTITAADASLAAGEYCTVTTNLEGQNVADFQYGGASAKQSVLTFLWKSPAGTYSVALHNSATNRSYVAQFTPTAANTDQYISIVIPGDTSGTWLTDTGIGITLDFVIAAGSTFQGTNNAWQAGLIYGTATNTNGVGTISSVFEVSDVQLNLDPDLTGIAPAWELPQYDIVLRDCMRFYVNNLPVSIRGYASAASANLALYVLFPVEMRIAPASIVGTTTVAASNISAEAYESITSKGFRFRLTATAAGDTFVLERLTAASTRY